MKNAKLFKKLRKLITNTDNSDKEHIEKLRKVLHKLKKRQRKLAEHLQNIDSETERQKIEQEIEVLKLQRKKGVAVYKQLKQGCEEQSQDENS